jgi:hypothetical protein
MTRASAIASGTAALAAALSLGLACAAEPVGETLLSTPKKLQIVRTDTRPVIDGKLDEDLWQRAAVIDDLRQIRPNDGAPPSERTIVYVTYDKDALYVAARMWDSGAPREITRNIMKQSSGLGEDDRLAIVIDPFNSRRQGYRFEVNANSVRNDMLYQGGKVQPEWTVIWEAAGAVNDAGWTAEIAIPFKTLPFDPTIDEWGFNVSRAIRRRGEEMVWVSRNRAFNPSTVGVLSGMRDLDQGTGLDVVPGFSLAHRKSYVTSESEVKGEPSLDLYYRVTPAFSASLTFNTDFSATEVDERQVNLTRFSPFFPEKRDFFLNDADLFEFGRIGTAGFSDTIRSVARPGQENARPFFSRRVGLSALGTPVDLNYGGKLSGRIGKFNIGMLVVQQDEFVFPDGGKVDPATLAVTRVTANVLAESSVGFIATSGNPLSNTDNSLVGADFLYLNSQLPGGRSLEAEAWYQQTDTEGLAGHDRAFGAGVRIPNSSGMRGGVGLRQIEANFFPALGFVNRTDIRDAVVDVGYTHIVGGKSLQSVYVGVDGDRTVSLDGGTLLSQVIALRPLELESRGRDTLRFIYTANDERVVQPFRIYDTSVRDVVLPPGRYEFDDYGFDLVTGPQRRYAGEFRVRRGDFYSGERLNLGGKFVWKQSRYFTLRLGYDWNSIDLPEGDFVTRLMSTTVELALSSQWNWINLFQYDDVSEVFGLHSRLSWIPRAGQEVFVVLNRNVQDFDKDNSFDSVNSEFSAKVNYTLRF